MSLYSGPGFILNNDDLFFDMQEKVIANFSP